MEKLDDDEYCHSERIKTRDENKLKGNQGKTTWDI
jgi:hypothetical protein